jgi:hypothetical protein
MRDRLLSFSWPTQTAGSGQFGVTAPSANGVTTLSHASATGSPAAITTELNYGGLLVNTIPATYLGAPSVLDNDNSGTVDANDYVRGQILTPLYVTLAVQTTAIAIDDTLQIEVHGSNTQSFSLPVATGNAATVQASTIWTPPVAFVQTLAVTNAQVNVVSPNGGLVQVNDSVKFTTTVTGFTAGTVYYVVSVVGNNIQLSATRGGAAITPTSVVTFVRDVNSALISVPVQSYAKFIKVRAVSGTLRTGGLVAVGRCAFQTGREGTI